MDTSSDAVATDTLGRRIAPRHRHTRGEKRAMVEKSLTPGVSVALVARVQGLGDHVEAGMPVTCHGRERDE
jgi:transposase-like protein